jgi:hypothetical protein
MKYVLRQIKPPGKSALASQATLEALAEATLTNSVEYGEYLEWSDPDADNGLGAERWTDDITKARTFAKFADAMECWMAQSTVRPLRPDRHPNRPLTAWSVTVEKFDDDMDDLPPPER